MFLRRLPILLLALTSFVSILASAKPARVTRPIPDDLPKLSEILTVAKSPLEPITLKPTLPDGRNTGSSAGDDAVTENSEPPIRERVTTVEPDEQVHDTTTLGESTLAESLSDIVTTTVTSTPMIITTFATVSSKVFKPEFTEVSATSEFNADLEATTPEPVMETTRMTAPTNDLTATPMSPIISSTLKDIGGLDVVTETQAMRNSNTPVDQIKQKEEHDMTTMPTTTTTSTTQASTVQSSTDKSDSREILESNLDDSKETMRPETTSEIPITTELITIVNEQKLTNAQVSESSTNQTGTVSITTEASKTDEFTSLSSTTTTIPITTTTVDAESPSTRETTTSPINTSTTSKSVDQEPVAVPTAATVINKATDVNQTAPSTVVAPMIKNEESSKKVTDEEKQMVCKHLPTYEADEIQKVFREETTYRNGTIKGKFTYINFDQRYRLVHYTRLPYGPVKIDFVEELGKSEGIGSINQSYAPMSIDDVPNAVLQLRNILPNSLYGFPFIGPSSPSQPKSLAPMAGQQQQQQPQRELKNDHQDLDRSSMYFYSTDTISTPNLLTPTVPVSVLPSQRRQIDTLISPQAFVSGPQQQIDISTEREVVNEKKQSIESQNLNHTPHQHQSITNLPILTVPDVKPQLTAFSHLNQMHHYQYSPVPLYTFQQPSYYSPAVRHQLVLPPPSPPTSNLNKPQLDHLGTSVHDSSSFLLTHHQTHQPHSHEHYIAPFMFSQQSSLHVNDQTETSKLKLRVKTSKSLSQETTGKSAQLKASPQSIYSTPLNSPSQVHRAQQQNKQARHRLGKQNQELKQTINQTPVVYHVLRSPVGRVYTLPQYNQAHAMAYDHED